MVPEEVRAVLLFWDLQSLLPTVASFAWTGARGALQALVMVQEAEVGVELYISWLLQSPTLAP